MTGGVTGGGRHLRALATVITLAAVAVLFRGPIFGGEVLAPTDLLGWYPPWSAHTPDGWSPSNRELQDPLVAFHPWLLEARERFAQGELPLWNPRAALGQPLFANHSAALASPFHLFHLVMPFGAAQVAGHTAKLLLAVLFTALLARRLGVSVAAALFAGLAFGFGAFHYLLLDWPQSGVSAFLPVLLYLVESWRGRVVDGARGGGPLFALAVTGMLLAGHIQTSLHVSVIVGLYALLRTAGADMPSGRQWRWLAAVALWGLVGLAGAAVQLLPFAEYMLHSAAYALRSEFTRPLLEGSPGQGLLLLALTAGAVWAFVREPAPGSRLGVGAQALLATALAASALILARELGLSSFYEGLFHPDRYGHPLAEAGRPYAGPLAYVEVNAGYVGLPTLGLALLGLVCAPRSRGLTVFSLLGLLAAVMAFRVPVVGPALEQLPLFELTRNRRLAMVVGFSAAMLAAFGLDAVTAGGRVAVGAALRRPVSALWWRAAALVTAVTLAGLGVDRLAGGEEASRDEVSVLAQRDNSLLVAALEAGAEPRDTRGDLVLAPGTVRGGPVHVEGWAVMPDGPDAQVIVELWQDGSRRDAVVPASAFTAPPFPLPDALADHPRAGRCWFTADLPTEGFDGGLIRIIVRFGAGIDAFDAAARWIRYEPSYTVRVRWWLLGAAAVLLLIWVTGPGRRRVATPWLAVALLGGELFLFTDGFYGGVPPEGFYPTTPTLEYLQRQSTGTGPRRLWASPARILPPNTAMAYGLQDVRSYDGLEIQRTELFLAMLRTDPVVRHTQDAAHPLYDLLGVEFVVASSSWRPRPGTRFQKVFEADGLKILANRRSPERAWVAPAALSVSEAMDVTGFRPEAAAERHRRVAEGLGQRFKGESGWRDVVIIEDDGEGDAPAWRGEPVAPAPADFTFEVEERLRDPERVEYDVETSHDGWFVLADAFYPGWTATVDGRPAEIVPAYLAFRAVAVPAGRSRVVMRYRPDSLRWGAALSSLGLLLMGLGALRRRR